MQALGAVVLLCSLGVEVDALAKVHGVNYGGRFVPEYYMMLPGTEKLFRGITQNDGSVENSLCDVGTADRQERMAEFLDTNIKEEHFYTMASLGFNVVRLPLAYWNLIDLPDGTTPSGPWRDRWMNLQTLQPSAKSYMKWIEQIFQYAQAAGMQILLDFHAAPGGQTSNQDCGCDLGEKPIAGVDIRQVYSPGFFENDWNHRLSVQAIEVMARLCASKGSICWGIELLNEPYGPLPKSIGPITNAGILDSVVGRAMLSRDGLQDFYLKAISVARKHIAKDIPIVIMDWAYWLQNYWKSRAKISFADGGNILFSTHMYPITMDPTTDLQVAKQTYYDDLNDASDFASSTGLQVLVTEYALAGHGNGDASDQFPYHNMTRWLVRKMDDLAGGMVWNFDAVGVWGSVDNADELGISWGDIYGVSPPSSYFNVFKIVCITGGFAGTAALVLVWLQKKQSADAGSRIAQPSQRAGASGVTDRGTNQEEGRVLLAADATGGDGL